MPGDMLAQTGASLKRAREERAPGVVAAFPGDIGSLAHIAATRFFGHHEDAQLKGVRSFSNVFDAVSAGEALYGVVPIENSSSGTLHGTYDLLLKHDVVILAELGVRERYCLCAKPSTSLADVRRVLSHPNILDACSSFVQSRLSDEASHDTVLTRHTTDAVRRVVAGESDGVVAAAIATSQAAKHQGLAIIADDIGNDHHLESRYILICRRNSEAIQKPCPFPHDAIDPVRKNSACFALPNEPGAIFKLLSCWAMRDINILKVETRPVGAGHRMPDGLPAHLCQLWEYLFLVETEVPAGETQEAHDRRLESLKDFSQWQRDFGTFPSVVTRAPKEARSWSEMVDLMAKC